jgi:hypothetical protein
MTVYSGTYQAPEAGGRGAFRDPLAEARDKLRQAARLPFHAARPNSWQESFRQLTRDARADVRRHIWMASLPDSPLRMAERAEPRLGARIRQEREDHDLFAERLDELLEAADGPAPDIWKMIELGEQAILLEMALARHHNRLSQLLHESTHQDIGVAG